MKRAYVLTNGCPENRIDSARMKKCLELNGWGAAGTPAEADFILFNACGLVDRMEEFSLRILRKLKNSKRPDARLVVCGCLPKINPAILAKEYGDVTFGSDDIAALIRLISGRPETVSCSVNCILSHTDAPKPRTAAHIIRNALLRAHPYTLLAGRYKRDYERLFERINILSESSYYIKVATGCLNECSYCAVKLSRGTLQSKPIDAVLEEQRQGLQLGFTEFCLIGTDLGCYGRDRQTTLVDLLRQMTGVSGEFSIKLRNVNAKFMILMAPDLASVFGSGKVAYMSSAVQSGSNRILQLMNRGYTVEEYKNTIGLIKSAAPDLQLRSQVIVGFPGETEDDFEATLRVVEDVDFDFVEIYMYSPRAGTRAFGFPGRVPRRTILRRYSRMLKTVTEKCGSKLERAG